MTRMAGVILGLLILASGITAGLRRARPDKDFGELAARVRAWWAMAGILFGALALGETVSIVFFCGLSYWAFKEYITLLKTRPADHRALVWSFLAIPVQYYWVATGWYGMFVLFIPVFLFLWLPVRLVMAKETAGFVASASEIQWGLMAFVFGLSHLGYLLKLPDGRSLLLFLVFTTELSDVFQYVWGKLAGRRKIIPSVSPNKTWEGFLGGTLTASLCGTLMRFLTPFSASEAFEVALLVTLAGFCGGAVMSAVKRDFGVKDFGSLIPGHGGVLDRMDSLCYAAPVFFHYVRYFHC